MSGERESTASATATAGAGAARASAGGGAGSHASAATAAPRTRASATPPRRRLIVSGDDFGLSPEVNRAIVRAHREGILTSASLMVAAPAVLDAVALARETPSLAVGLHLVLVQGRAARPPAELAGLARSDGSFREQAIAAAVLYFFHPALRRAVAREIRGQLDAFRATGLELSHVDGHLNLHLHPVAQRVLAEVAPEVGIRALRLTRDPIGESLRWDRRHALRKAFEGTALRVLSTIAARRFRPLGLAFSDRLYGLHQSGGCDEAYLRYVIGRLPPGVSEIYCHPAERQTPELRRLMPRYCHEAELAALTSLAVRALVEREGIELVTYKDLDRPEDGSSQWQR